VNLTVEYLRAAWMAAKEGILNESDLSPIFGHETFKGVSYAQYECPCGGDHVATRPFIVDHSTIGGGFWSEVLTCYQTNPPKQWAIRVPSTTTIAGIIRAEEEKYLALIKAAPKTVIKVVRKMGRTDEAFAFLNDTHGIDRETAENILDLPEKIKGDTN